MFKRLKHFINKQNTLEKRIFCSVNLIGILVSVVSTAFILYENPNKFAGSISFLCCILFLAILIVAIKTDKHDICYLATCLTIILLPLPVLYFICGGMDSGMPLYFLAMIILSSLNQDIIYRNISVVCSFASFAVCYILGKNNPELVQNISKEYEHFSIACSFFIIGLALALIILVVMNSYNREHKRIMDLNERLKELSEKDALTNVYNRRALFSYFESETFKNDSKLYIAMFDIDNFKYINDTYGHSFGDSVLAKIGKIFNSNVREMLGEFAARYGGEEFVYIISAEDYPEAVKRADIIRSALASTNWSLAGGVSITMSGGIAKYDINEPDGVKKALKLADEYLYVAKSEGKNRIKRVGCDIVINSMVFRR